MRVKATMGAQVYTMRYLRFIRKYSSMRKVVMNMKDLFAVVDHATRNMVHGGFRRVENNAEFEGKQYTVTAYKVGPTLIRIDILEGIRYGGGEHKV